MSRARDLADRVLHNRTHEDTEGGRESILTFKGEQSGGEISTLAQIQASHDGTSDDEKADLIFKTNDGSDGTSPTEAARIDSGQNFIVGKSTVDYTNAGVMAQSNGTFSAVKDGGAPAIINRLTSDGDIALFRKDGTTVGSIGSRLGANIVITAPTATYFDSSIRPLSDNSKAIGTSSLRFTDLYLSGGAYLGGTVAANKLEDYETGSFTATVSSGTVGANTFYYTKIGRLVTVTGILGAWSDTTSGNVVEITNLPFSPSVASQGHAAGTSMWEYLSVNKSTAYMLSTGRIRFYHDNTSSGYNSLKHSDLTSSSTSVHVIFSYHAA